MLDYFNQMKDAGTSIQLKDYKVKIDEFMGSLDFKMRLNDQLKPVGRAEVKFKNIADSAILIATEVASRYINQ